MKKKRLFNNIIQIRIDMIRYTVYVYSKQEERERKKLLMVNLRKNK